MNLEFRRRHWALPLAALLALLALVALAPRLGLTKAAQAPLWTERPVVATPAVPEMASIWVKLAKELKPAVVNISTKRQENLPELRSPFGQNDPFNQFFKRFFGEGPRTVRSLGSGFVINQNGYVVTNNHVVDGATEITVRLSDGRELPAKVLGRDPKTDIALLKIEATGLPVIPLGDSSQLQVGEPVMAIGNPFGLEQTVTTGIVSATGRVIGEGPYDDFIQTDASINPGNSGGPLLNTHGQAVGINAAIFSQSGGSIGIGFAIPINLAKSVVAQLGESGHVVRGWLGIAIQRLTPELGRSFNLADTHGALVASVAEGSPAMKAGIKPGDVIVEYNERQVARSDDLPRAVAETPVGREVPITVVREGQRLTLRATIAKLAEPEQQAALEGDSKASLGLAVQPLTPALARELGLPDRRGVVVREVKDGSPAENAGIERGDVIVEVDHHPIASVEDMKRALDKHSKGKPVLLLVHRGDAKLYVAIAA